MNTFQNLIDNGIEPHTAQDMIDGYAKRIGTMNGIYEITDITYDFAERGKDVTLKCSMCGREIYRMMISSRNKWSELIKSCPCEKERAEREYQERLRREKEEKRNLILSRVNQIFGDYKIVSVSDLENNNPRYIMRCIECGEEMNVSANSFWQRANFECKKHRTPTEPIIKYDESYIGRKKNLFYKILGKCLFGLIVIADGFNTRLVNGGFHLNVAQFGSAPDLGSGGCRFESRHSDLVSNIRTIWHSFKPHSGMLLRTVTRFAGIS